MTEEASVTIPLHRPKLKEKLFFLLSGVIVSIPLTLFITSLSGFLPVTMSPTYGTIISVVLLAPVIEEFSKAYPLFYRHAETERSIFTLGFLVGLGFGIAEFVEYVVFLNVPFILRLPGIFFHASSTSIIAYGIGRKQAFPFYLIAVALHLSNNLLSVLSQYVFFSFAVSLLTYFLAWHLHGKTRERIIPMEN
jgi:hypothetical protein